MKTLFPVLLVLVCVACSSNSPTSHAADGGPMTPPKKTNDSGTALHDASAADGGDDPQPDSRNAVQDTLAHNAACQAISPFYWEIGTSSGPVVSGSIGSGYTRDTQLEIASSSKWVYGAAYLQQHTGELSADEIKFLNFTSGYASITGACLGRTIAACNKAMDNETPGTVDKPGADDSAVDHFDYNSGHLEQHAEKYANLGSQTALTLGAKITSMLGIDLQLSYVNPLLAGGIRTSPAQYALFLQHILSGDLKIHDQLGTHSSCTLSADYATLFHETCAAVTSPWWPATSGKQADTADLSLVQDVHYSLAHWVESDGTFSSPGLYGFYPWIDASKTWYGMIARRQIFQVFDEAHPDTSAYARSVQCGQAVRAAWLDGTTH